MLRKSRASASEGGLAHRVRTKRGPMASSGVTRRAPCGGGLRHSASKTRVNALKANPPYALRPSQKSCFSAVGIGMMS
jgi:hypothetical protein